MVFMIGFEAAWASEGTPVAKGDAWAPAWEVRRADGGSSVEASDAVAVAVCGAGVGPDNAGGGPSGTAFTGLPAGNRREGQASAGGADGAPEAGLAVEDSADAAELALDFGAAPFAVFASAAGFGASGLGSWPAVSEVGASALGLESPAAEASGAALVEALTDWA